MMKRIAGVCLLGAALALAGCGTTRREQLHRVAKDWSETIRASQVIAVYPLTQDVQPGDVFLVQTPIDKQQEIYKEDGFLPLDNHLARLDPDGYPEFYKNSFLGGAGVTTLPKDWLTAAWKTAPSAAFPSYAFSVTKAAGLNMAIPVSGVPVGLSLLGTQAANGTVSLKDARTIGVDTLSMYEQLRGWATTTHHARDFLANFGTRRPGDDARNYLRVITRVYLLGEIDVQLNDARSVGGGLDAGAARPVELFLPKLPTGVDDTRSAGQETYLRGVQRLSAMGGTGGAGFLGSRAGDDAGLNAEAFAAREEARETERKAELERAKQERDAAQAEHKKAVEDADTSPEGVARTDAIKVLNTAITEQEEKEKALQEALDEEPPDAAKIDGAKNELGKAEDNVKTARTDLATAQKAFDDAHDKTIQSAAGKLDVKQTGLDRLQEFAPGASFRFTAASARSVSLTEVFDDPLVVGYLGFDVPIGFEGDLGPPIPTHALLGGSVSPPTDNIYRTSAIQNLYDALKLDAEAGVQEAVRTKASLDAMVRFLPVDQPKYRTSREEGRTLVFEPKDGGAEPADFADYVIYHQERKTAIENLDAVANAGLSVTVGGTKLTGAALRDLARGLEPAPTEERAYDLAVDRLFRYALRETDP